MEQDFLSPILRQQRELDRVAGYTPFSLFVYVLANYYSVCLGLVPSYVDTLHNIVAFVEKKYSKIERNKPATG